MKTLLTFTLSLAVIFCRAQSVLISNLSGTSTYGSLSVTVTSSGSSAVGAVTCIPFTPGYSIGFSGLGTGTFNYSFSMPVRAVGVSFSSLNAGPLGMGEYVQTTIDGSPYAFTAADILSYSLCPPAGSGPCYIYGGKLYGPIGTLHSSTDYNGAKFQISRCSGINSFGITCDGSWYGIGFDIWVDTSSGCSLTASNNGPICEEDTLKLFAITDTSAPYNWHGPGGFTSTLQNPVIPSATLANAGSYYVVQTLGSYADTAWTTVTINPKPSISASTNSPVCNQDKLLLFAGTFIPGETFTWSGSGGFVSTAQDPVRNPVSFTDSGSYRVIVTLNGCKDTAFVHVTIKPKPIATATSNSPLCLGKDLLLVSGTTLSGTIYNWIGPAGFSSNLTNPTITAMDSFHAGVYQLIVSLNGCSDTTHLDIVVTPPPQISASSNSPLCANNLLQLSVNPISSSETFQWTGPGGFFSTQPAPNIASTTTGNGGIYSVIASLNGCSDTAQTDVVINSLPDINLKADSPLCTGYDIRLYAYTSATNATYAWRGPNQFGSSQQDPYVYNATANSSGIYTAIVTANGCNNSTTLALNVIMLSSTLHDTMVCADNPISIQFAVIAPAESNVLWNTGSHNKDLQITDTGRYEVTISDKGCEFNAMANVTGERCNCDLIIPNAFTPNKDGKDDTYYPIIPNGCAISEYTFSIFNRWGQQVFQTHDINEKWDGAFLNANCELGVYVYYISYTADPLKKHYLIKGDVTLVR